MAKVLTSEQKSKIKKAIFKRADEFGYASSGRNDSGRFMDELVNDPEVGGVLKEYMSKERIRTYIKDGVLNAYTKELTKKILATTEPETTVKMVFDTIAAVIQNCKGKDSTVTILRSEDGNIFVVSGGTVLKWETALRKALEIIAREPGLLINGKTPFICLNLAAVSQNITEADKKHIKAALLAVNIQAVFCEG